MANREKLERYEKEVNGDSQDRAMRPALEANARAFLEKLSDGSLELGEGWFADNVKLVRNLDAVGGILECEQEIVDEFEDCDPSFTIVPNSILADRGRVYCLVTTFTFVDGDGAKDDYYYEQQQHVILDLDKNHKYTRVEFRDVIRKRIKRKGGYEDFTSYARNRRNDAAEAAEEDKME